MSPFGLSMDESSKASYKWRRVLLKVSGEALAGDQAQNIDPKVWMQSIREETDTILCCFLRNNVVFLAI